MTLRLRFELSGLAKAEEQGRSSFINVLGSQRRLICQLQEKVFSFEKEIDSITKQRGDLEDGMAEYKIKFSKAVEDSFDAAAAVSEAATVTGEAMRVPQTPVWPISSAGSFDASAATSVEGTVELLKCIPKRDEFKVQLIDEVGAPDAARTEEVLGKYQEMLKTLQDKFNALYKSASEPSTAQSRFFKCDGKAVLTFPPAPPADIVQMLSVLDALQIDGVVDQLKALTAKCKKKKKT
ncbi:hypothetical protein ERJ75_000072000 [Trypanosoma vivax]|nr:hypothetical protein ERJ75_000072000 [Trypanosoma vivax]